MTALWQQTDEPLVLHVIPTPLARGAQREARALADQLDVPGVRAHRVLTIFDGIPEVRPDLSLHLDGGSSPATGFNPQVVLHLRRALRRLDPALVVAHGSDPLKYLVPALAFGRRPLAYYAIGTYAASPDHRLQLEFWRRMLARTDVIVAEGHEVRQQCIEMLGVPADKVTMTPNGRDPETFRPRTDSTAAGVPVVTFVGALNRGKRPDRFIEVVAALRDRGREFTAQLIGDGPMFDELEVPARLAGVKLFGSRSDIPDLLRDSDLIVFPSRPAGEGMPGVLIEAGMSGISVVATDVPGVRTMVDDGATGFVVPEGELAPLVDAADRLLLDASMRTTMGAAAREYCVDHFSLETVGAAWLALLQPLLAGGGHRRRS
jgi:glycosyltransferase involved in cell wall biosynthesis